MQLAEMAISKAGRRLKAAKKLSVKDVSGPALPGKLADCVGQTREDSELFIVEVTQQVVVLSKRVIKLSSYHANSWKNLKHMGSFF